MRIRPIVYFVAALAMLLLTACTQQQGTPAFTRRTPTPDAATLTAAAVARSFRPVRESEGPCVGVADPEEDTSTPESTGARSWSAPEQVVDPAHQYCAIITTAHGRIVLHLYPQVAPQHVNNFVFLARQGYYDGLTFHRVIEDFMAQTGDPTGTGTGGPGYTIPLEARPSVRFDRPGVLGMARTSDPDSAGSQFFITFGPQPSLDAGSSGPGYTVFGQVVEGMDVVDQISFRDPGTATEPGDTMISVRIVDLGPR